MAEWAKIAIKTAITATILGSLLLIISNISMPALDYSLFSTALDKGYAILNYWFPYFNHLWNMFVIILLLRISFAILKFSVISARVLMKVNE